MQHLADIEIDQKFQLHTSYHNDFFLLRTKLLVDGKSTEIRTVKEGSYEGPVLMVCHCGSTSCNCKLWLIANAVSPILHQFGVYHVDTFYYEQSPLFHTVFTSESCLKKFLLAIGEVKSSLERQLHTLLSRNVKSVQCHVPEAELPQQLTIEVQPELFLVSPNQLNTKGADLHAVTADNCSTLLTHWKSSKLFEFASLYQEEAQPPHITLHPASQNDVLPGGSLTHTIRATGAEPLRYQWQWKPAGKEDEQHEWRDLSCDGTTFQEVEGGLTLTGVQACHAGSYRCVVSNSAGSEISQCATLTVNVVPELLDLVKELRGVNNWKTLGLYLGIKIEKLNAIEMEHPFATIEERRTMMLEEWQNNVIPTWSAVVQALVGMGMRRLASNLAQKHGIPTPEEPDDEPVLEQLKNLPQQNEENVAKLHEDIQKLRDDLKQDRKILVDSEVHLRQLQESKQVANENAKDCLTELEKLREAVQKIAREKSNIEMELKFKEHECQLLSELKFKEHECQLLSEIKEDKAYSQFLQDRLAKKEKKINKLKQELERKECKLLSAQQEAQTWQEELSQARAEVRKKHEKVKELEREKEKLACSYNIKKEKFSNLVQIAFSSVKEMKQQIVSMKEESELNLQHMETSYNANIRHLSEEIEALTSSLQKKEAAAEHLQVASTPEQLLESLSLRIQIAELERKLQEAECQKQHAELKWEAAVQEVKARKEFETHLQNELRTPLKLRWKKRSNMLYAMSRPKTVQLHNNIYMGGGYSDSFSTSVSELCTVLNYNQLNDTWSKLPKYDCYLFGMSAINSHLTLVGGRDRGTSNVSKKVGVWEPSSQQWTQPYPPMITPRYFPEVATYNNYLLAAGGGDNWGGALTTVELLDISDGKQWLTVTQVPVPCAYKTSAISNNNWYIITDNKQTLYCSLPELCSQALNESAATKTPARWQCLADTLLERTTAIAVSGSILTVGGHHDNTASTAIHLYHPETNTWSVVGNLPTPQYYCSATVLASGELLVSGGRDQQGKLTTLVSMATILD